MIPYNVIEDIKYRSPIEDVVSKYVNLQRAGSNMKGLCPFHSEKTPSFTVYTGNGSFYCFGCGAGGDVISFIMRAENLEYVAAVEYLAARCGISLPEDDNFTKTGVSRTRVMEMNRAAAKFFHSMLSDENAGKRAREYVAKRMIDPLCVRHFGIGFAPDSFDALRSHMKQFGFTEKELITADLCRVSSKGNTYDTFRNRLMFPIIDTSGNVIAFGGRVMDDSQPKYLNTSDTPAFKKSRNLFALNFAKNFCSEKLIVCEGYMDVVAMHSAGFENSVATLGTAITPDHARIIKRITKKVILSYDSDGAGQAATDKAIRLLGETGIDASVLAMEGAKDPDEYIKKYGKVRFEQLLNDSLSRFDFIVRRTTDKYKLENADERVRAARDLCYIIASLDSRIEREILTEKCASALNIDAKSIIYDTEVIIKRNKFQKKKSNHEELIRHSSGVSDRINPDYAKNPAAARLECSIIGMMLADRALLERVCSAGLVSGDNFVTLLNRRLFEFMVSAYRSGGFDFGMLSESFTPEEVSRAAEYLAKRSSLKTSDAAEFDTACRRLCDMSDSQGSSVDDIMALINKKKSGAKNI